MARTRNTSKVSDRDFLGDPERFLKGVETMDAPLVITSRGKPLAVLLSADEYEEKVKRIEGYERIMKELEKPEKARMEAHARVIAEIGRRGRKV